MESSGRKLEKLVRQTAVPITSFLPEAAELIRQEELFPSESMARNLLLRCTEIFSDQTG